MSSPVLVCKQCGSEFELTFQQELKYEARGFDLPERCAVCRKRKTRVPAQPGSNKHRDKKKHYRLKYMVSP